MIVPYIQGGLGNSLFQIAAAIGQAELTRNEWKIPASWKYRDYFSIPDEKYIDSYDLPRYKEPNFNYTQPSDMADCEMFGYFQSKKYWAHCERKIRQYIRMNPANPYLPKIENDMSDRCAVHIRGADYKQLSEYHFNLPKEYYQEAMWQSRFTKFTIFTDDAEHARQIIPDGEIPIIPGDRQNDVSTVSDLFDMANFGGLIMANSSYSWWAQWLNPNINKVVYAPPKDKWFGKLKSHYITDDLYCDNWEVVNYETRN